MRVKKKGKWDDRCHKTEWKYFRDKMKKLYIYVYLRLFTHKRKLVPEIVPLWLKNRNQCVHIRGLMRGKGLYEEGLIRGVTQVVRKRWAYVRRSLYAGAYTWRSTVHCKMFSLKEVSIHASFAWKIGLGKASLKGCVPIWTRKHIVMACALTIPLQGRK